MKRLIIVGLLVLGLGVLTAGLVTANEGPHGGYTATTDACAGCHRAHTAPAGRLLLFPETELCLSCHGVAGAGANTDVETGIYDNTGPSGGPPTGTVGAPLMGGLFGDVSLGAGPSYTGTTSVHEIRETEPLAWGIGGTRGVSNTMAGGAVLKCSSCHDPHGSPNYRILKATVNGIAVTTLAEGGVPDEANKTYNLSITAPSTEKWGSGMSSFCAACHPAYHELNQFTGSNLAANTYLGGYAHRIDMPWNAGTITIGVGTADPETLGLGGYYLPLEDTPGLKTVACTTCHYPHGTAATMSGYSDGGPTGTGTLPGTTSAGDSALLRLPNHGVCQVCHQK